RCTRFSFVVFCFFFSSRRRHTRFKCDWSSDVCSSDLISRIGQPLVDEGFFADLAELERYAADLATLHRDRGRRDVLWRLGLDQRSEERRVGKEWRRGWGRED